MHLLVSVTYYNVRLQSIFGRSVTNKGTSDSNDGVGYFTEGKVRGPSRQP